MRDEICPIRLTPAEKAQLDTRARSDLIKVVVAQAAVASGVAVVAGLIAGVSAFWSALAGSGAYFVPNLFFALRLFAATFSSKTSSPLSFVFGQMLKVLMVLALLGVIAKFGGDRIQWLAVIVGLIAVLKAYLVVLALTGFKTQKYLR
jgi:ATP synthase protein I